MSRLCGNVETTETGEEFEWLTIGLFLELSSSKVILDILNIAFDISWQLNMMFLLTNYCTCLIIPFISLGMLVLNSKDWHERNGYRIFHTLRHTLK